MQYRLKSLFIVMVIFGVAAIIYRQNFMEFSEPPPLTLLEQLDERFDSITPEMTESEVFDTLGLKHYYSYLKRNSRMQMDGAGGDWIHFIDHQDGYSLAMRSFKAPDTDR